ncbi:hypothetical protein [Acidaminobacter sp. JC074]|uniref:nSTAND3 domain-containing NTPase n=1 Tax=Acidaminobacter sp. JC074 TaxID=2530199 RepID=UPI001F103819|nr:hypothetical protein [Acidaminobacter sp. JC074]
MHRLILIEGIPGSGKTTISRRLADELSNDGYKVLHVNEGGSHPADLSWQSILTEKEFKALVEKYPSYKEVLNKHTLIEDELAITAYTCLGLDKTSDLYKYLEKREIYSIDADIETFKRAHINRWKKFVKEADKDAVYVFECVLLQNHITQLILEYEADKRLIRNYMNDFVAVIKDMSPIIHYLAPASVENAIRHVAEERRPKYQDRQDIWIDRVLDYVRNTPYGKRHNLKSIEGFIGFTSHRQAIELELLKALDIHVNIIEHENRNWDQVFSRILEWPK